MSSPHSTEYPNFKTDFILLTVGLLLLFMVGLGGYPYSVPSESRYIEIPRQMVETGDWLTPRLNGVKYFEKPPLFYWIQAAQLKLFGMGEFSGRLWTALFMTGMCLVTFVAAYYKYGRLEGLLSPLILASSVLGFISSRIVLLDVPVSFFLVLGLFSFMFAVQIPPGRMRDILLAVMYGSAALATLTKGLIGIAIPAMVIGSWIALTNRWKLLGSVRLVPGLLLFFIVAAPWHFLVGQATPEFYYFYFIHEHFERFLTEIHGRYKPPWYFVVVLLVGLLPWTVFFFQSVTVCLKTAWANRNNDGGDLYLLLWVGLPLLFFSLSDSKLAPYILPIFPVVALLIARYLATVWKSSETAGYRVGVYSMFAFFLLMATVYPVMVMLGGKTAQVVAPIASGATALSIILALQAIAMFVMMRYRFRRQTVVVSTVVFAVIFVSFVAYLAPRAAIRSTSDSAQLFAAFLKPRLQTTDEVAVFNHYYQDLPVYLNRNVTVVNAFGEMSFGHSIEQRTHQWMIDADLLRRRWDRSNRTLYMLLSRSDYEIHCPTYCPGAHIIMDNGGRHLLISNRPKKK